MENRASEIKNAIIEAYLKLRDKCEVYIFDRFNVVILMRHNTFKKLIENDSSLVRYVRDIDCMFINLFGGNTPIILTEELPENVLFQIMTQKDYERIEKEKLIEKFNKMFFS